MVPVKKFSPLKKRGKPNFIWRERFIFPRVLGLKNPRALVEEGELASFKNPKLFGEKGIFPREGQKRKGKGATEFEGAG